MEASALPLELGELGVLGWSLVELGQAELAASNPNFNPIPTPTPAPA